MITLALDLNLIPMGVMPRLNVSQYDHGQDVECGLYDGAMPYSIPNGTTAVVQGTKADNTGFEYPCTISNNEVTFKIADQMTVYAGDVTCEVVLLNGEDRIGTINFLLRVEPTALKNDVVISDTDLPLLQQIPEALLEAQTAAEDAQEWAEKSQEYAVGALHWKGNVTFANLPTSDLTAGDVYSVTDDFTTDSRFNEGAGIPCEAGTNIIWGTNGKWDLQARNAVYSFNGRKGAVVPASGDYTAAQITHGNSNVGADIEALQDRWKTITNGNMNNITTNGVYNCVNCSNCPLDEDDEPIATNWSMLVMATDANNVYQFVTSFDTGFQAVFSRKKVRGTWKVWTNSNIDLVWDSISVIQNKINTINTDLQYKYRHKYAISAMVDISSYNTDSKRYTCPSDGYVELRSNTGSFGLLLFQEENGRVVCYSQTVNTINSVYVRKGQVLRVSLNGNAEAHFVPLGV